MYLDEVMKILEQAERAEEERLVKEKIEDGTLNPDFAIIIHPKHRDAVMHLFNSFGRRFPLLFTEFIPENKFYVITDPEIVKNIKWVIGLPKEDKDAT